MGHNQAGQALTTAKITQLSNWMIVKVLASRPKRSLEIIAVFAVARPWLG
jgi:hypothetical protein